MVTIWIPSEHKCSDNSKESPFLTTFRVWICNIWLLSGDEIRYWGPGQQTNKKCPWYTCFCLGLGPILKDPGAVYLLSWKYIENYVGRTRRLALLLSHRSGLIKSKPGVIFRKHNPWFIRLWQEPGAIIWFLGADLPPIWGPDFFMPLWALWWRYGCQVNRNVQISQELLFWQRVKTSQFWIKRGNL